MTAPKQKRKPVTTPKGRAEYPRLDKPDTKFVTEGVYKIDLCIPAADAAGLKNNIDEVHAEAIALANAELKEKGKKGPAKENGLPYEERADGTIVFKFKTNASGKDPKTGETFEIRPALFDRAGTPLPAGTRVGGGSLCRVSFIPLPYVKPLGSGVTLRLSAVQVIEMQHHSAPAASFGFSSEDEEAAGEVAGEVAGEEAPAVKLEGSTPDDF